MISALIVSLALAAAPVEAVKAPVAPSGPVAVTAPAVEKKADAVKPAPIAIKPVTAPATTVAPAAKKAKKGAVAPVKAPEKAVEAPKAVPAAK